MRLPVWDSLSWGERTKQMYAGLEELPEEQVKKAASICYSDHSPGKCNDCPLKRYGCSDRMDVEVWRRLRRLQENEKANKLIEDFEVCYSDGLPARCRKCSYDYHKGNGCKEEMLRDAWEIIDAEKAQEEK